MNRIIISVFDGEEQAFKGLSALKELHFSGDISLYATAVIMKNDDGKVEMKSLSEKGPLGKRVGLISGAFVGLIAGPVGMAIGASIGALGDMLYNSTQEKLGRNFIDEVAKELEEGKTAVIAEVEEGWETPVNTKMTELHAMVFRFNTSEKMEELFEREWDSTQKEMEELKDELEVASDDAQEEIKAQISVLQNKLGALREMAENELTKFIESSEAKVDELKKQIDSGTQKAKKRLEKRLIKAEKSLESGRKMFEEAIDKFSKEITL